AYSMVSPNYEETLEWFSIKVPDGPLTSRLQHIKEGDRILVSKKPVGTLIVDNLKPGRTLYLLSTGTGLAPFMSIIRDPESYERFERIVLVHGCRIVAELAYGELITKDLPVHEYLGDDVRDKLIYYPTVTREPYHNKGRITDLITSGKLFEDLDLPVMDPEHDRVMLCGNPDLITDMRAILKDRSFKEGSSGKPAEYVIEKAFVEK
ncbi:MAG: ferredoxin--NADP reductase, partial [Pseudomonadota bacterium]